MDWTPQDPDTGNPYRYTGRRYDPETGNYYYRARYYSPKLGRFLQTDPVGRADDLNLYAYVTNDPLNKFDPLGLTGLDDEIKLPKGVEEEAMRQLEQSTTKLLDTNTQNILDDAQNNTPGGQEPGYQPVSAASIKDNSGKGQGAAGGKDAKDSKDAGSKNTSDQKVEKVSLQRLTELAEIWVETRHNEYLTVGTGTEQDVIDARKDTAEARAAFDHALDAYNGVPTQKP